MRKVCVVTAIIVCLSFFGISASAEYLPIYDDFNTKNFNALDKWSHSWTLGTAEHYVKCENDKLVISAGAMTNDDGTVKTTDSAATKTLDAPIDSGTAYIEFDFSVADDCILKSWWGAPYAEDSEGTTTPLLKFSGAMGYTGTYLGEGLDWKSYMQSMDLKTGQEYSVKIEINLENNTYKVYIDGELKKRIDGTSTHVYKGSDLKKVVFNVTNDTSKTSKLFVDDFKIYTDTVKAVYVSENGSDLNDGSVEKPFKTIEKAVEAAKENENSYVVLKSGTYQAPIGTVWGGEDINRNSNVLNFYTEKNAEVVIEGLDSNRELIADVDSLNITEDFKDKVKQKISAEYIENFAVFPLVYGNASRTITDGILTTKMSIFNNGASGYPLTFISAIYKDGILKDVKIVDDLLVSGKNDIEVVHDSAHIQTITDSHRLFIWDSTESLRPMHTVVYDIETEKVSNVPFASVDSVELSGGGALTIKGNATSDMVLTVKVLDGGEIIYIDQMRISSGDFEKECNINPTLSGFGMKIIISGKSV